MFGAGLFAQSVSEWLGIRGRILSLSRLCEESMRVNFLEAMLKGRPTKTELPLHVGEAMSLWAYAVAAEESRALCLLLVNHTADKEMKELIEHFIADVEEPQINTMRQVLKDVGIMGPTATGDKPVADERQIPTGAKFTDDEIANLLVVKLEGLLTLAHAGITQSLRDDIGALFFRFYAKGMAQAYTLKHLSMRRGWLRVPPFYRPGQPVGSGV